MEFTCVEFLGGWSTVFWLLVHLQHISKVFLNINLFDFLFDKGNFIDVN